MIWKTLENTFQISTMWININRFFKKLFKKQNNVFHGKKCVRCDEFLPNSRYKVIHDFLVHYEAGKDAFKEKPLTYTAFGEIRKYEITFSKHLHEYDFYNAEKLVDEFLLNAKNKVARSNIDFFIKCSFSLENIQPSATEDEQTVKNSRYWSTEPYQTKSFNDFIYFNLRESILKRVINNGLTGSSWHFNCFLYINVQNSKCRRSVILIRWMILLILRLLTIMITIIVKMKLTTIQM